MTKSFRLLAAALVACRFYNFRPYLDHPHLFRQADTAFYSLGFYRFGMNLFTPSVGWMGGYRRVILEFPLTEWLAAWVYFVAGPTILVDRLVNLAFFLGSACFLFRVVSLLHDRVLAQIVALLYMSAPLGIYYSRAVHIDFTAIFFSHALLFYSMRFVATNRWTDLASAILTGTLAFVIKAPYAFYLIMPAFFFCQHRRAGLRTVLLVGVAFAVPAAAFAGWFAYSQWINQQAPDLSFIPSYFRHVNRFYWYFGTPAQRWTLDPWQTVVGRVYREVAATVWWALVPLGLLARDRLAIYYRFSLWWLAGTLIYLLLFLNLSEMHNYYQIPFIAPFSLGLAAPIYHWWTATGRWARPGRITATLALTGYAASSMFVATERFYRTDPDYLAIGEFVRARTSDDDLVIMANTDATHADPSFLFYARRYGWSVGHDELSPRILHALAAQGATVVVTSTMWPPDEETESYLRTTLLVDVMRVDHERVTVHRLAPPATRP